MSDPTELNDLELLEAFDEAKRDLEAAARDKPESEWHQACFAGVMVYAYEMASRGMATATVH